MKFFLSTFIFLFLFINFGYNQQTVGLIVNETGSQNGYILFAPAFSKTTYLIDKCGKLVHSWESNYRPGLSVFLLEDGSLLRTANSPNPEFGPGATCSHFEKFDWNGKLIWSYTISDDKTCGHHDMRPLPNGNILVLAWDLKTNEEAIIAGRNPSNLDSVIWSEKIMELQPIGTNEANIIWEWNFWDHLVQDYDSIKSNYGIISDHPELLDLNFSFQNPNQKDWLHANALDYNESLDQIIINSHSANEFFIIDHSTTTLEAASHNGGKYGKGGDFLYRWGNPSNYDRGTVNDKSFFGPHNIQWIRKGLKDQDNILLYNNGLNRPEGEFSDVEILKLPVDSNGNYLIEDLEAFKPEAPYWKYIAPVPTDFFSKFISGAQRLSNGNTLICEGNKGNFFEIDSLDNIVWKYINPVGQNGPVTQGTKNLMNSVFRCTLYEPDYTGFNGHILSPGEPIELNPLAYQCDIMTETKFSLDDCCATIINLISSPTEKDLIISINKDLKNANIQLFDITGQLLISWNQTQIIKNQPMSLELIQKTLPGIYILRVHNFEFDNSVKIIKH